MNKWSEQVICSSQYSSLYLWISQPPGARGSQKPSKQTLAVFSSFALHGLGSPNDQRKTRRTPSEEKDTSLSKSNVEYVVNVESVALPDSLLQIMQPILRLQQLQHVAINLVCYIHWRRVTTRLVWSNSNKSMVQLINMYSHLTQLQLTSNRSIINMVFTSWVSTSMIFLKR